MNHNGESTMKKLLIVTGILLAVPSAAQARGTYLHLSEANILAKRAAAKVNGVVVLRPCVRTGRSTASCDMTQFLRPHGVVCSWTGERAIKVRKWREGQRVRWYAKAGRSACRLVA